MADFSYSRQLLKQGAAHAVVLLALVYSLVLLEHNALATAAAPMLLVAVWAVVSGLLLSHIIHEWGHFLGASLAGSTLTLKPRVSPLFFDFDYAANARWQFVCLSLGGLLGNIILLFLVLEWLAPGTTLQTYLLAAVVGQFVFVLVLELPVPLAVLVGGREPLAALTAHFGQGAPLFLRALLMGLGAAVLVVGLS